MYGFEWHLGYRALVRKFIQVDICHSELQLLGWSDAQEMHHEALYNNGLHVSN